jgi:hypothetical protein
MSLTGLRPKTTACHSGVRVVRFSAMGFFRSGKLRYLYLLALAQLVGGPLVLLHVTVFCKLTLREAPRMGFAQAAAVALDSDEFRACASAGLPKRDMPAKESPEGDPKPKLEKPQQPPAPWAAERRFLTDAVKRAKIADTARTWTPAWPNAPPGPPPRWV